MHCIIGLGRGCGAAAAAGRGGMRALSELSRESGLRNRNKKVSVGYAFGPWIAGIWEVRMS